jgi:hypothetical protein
MENKNDIKYIEFNLPSDLDSKVVDGLNEVNLLFYSKLFYKRNDLLKYTPYKVNVSELVEKNQWTGGTCVAIEKDDGTCDLQLSFKKICDMEFFPTKSLTWVMFHEFRHKIQLVDESLKSVFDIPNWKNFKEYMMQKTNATEDTINHVFHELNPAEVDANIFATEMMGEKYLGNAFNITEQTLQLLKN